MWPAIHSRRLPRGPWDALRQLALFALAYSLYRLVRGFVYDGQVAVAFANARTLVALERDMGLFFEPTLQGWLLGEGWLAQIASLAYIKSHFVVTSGFLVWVYLTHNTAFYYVRNMFLLAMAMGLGGYAAFPTAPPRLLPEWGFSDTVAIMLGQAAIDGVEALYNPFAAVPSMHVAFALMVAIPAAILVRSRVLKLLWASYPGVVTLVVMVTGNHFWLDVALGAVVAAFAAYGAHAALARARPEVWRFQRSLAEAPA